MTALIGYVSRQIERTARSTRRLHWLMALLVIIALSGVVLTVQRAPAVVLYSGARVLVTKPFETEVCIGGAVHYSTVTEIKENEIPGRVEIDEAWCAEGLNGPCKAVIAPNPRMPLLEPKHIVTDRVERAVPMILTPGVYHFWHSATDAKGVTTGYIVAPITVLDCAK